MKKRTKRIVVIIIILSAVSLAVYFLTGKKQAVEYETAKIKTGQIVQTVSETGTVKAAKEIDLNFLNSGRIAKLPIKIGDKVKTGQVLAELDYRDLSLKERQARANLNIAQANLAKLQVGATSQEIAVSQANVKQAETAYQSSLAELDKIRKAANEAVAQAQKTLDDLESTVVTDGANNKRDPIITAVNGKLSVAKTALDAINTILLDDDAKDTLSVKDAAYLANTKTSYNEALGLVAPAGASLAAAKANKNDANLDQAVADSLSLLNKTLTSLYYCYGALEKSIASSKFTQAELDAYKTSISAQETLVSAGISAIQTAQQALKDALAAATNALSTAKFSAEQQTTAAQSKVDANFTAWQVAKAQLTKLLAPPRDEDLRLSQAQVAQAQASLDGALNEIDNSLIKAPIDGTVSKVNYEIGEQMQVGKAVISMVAESNFEVEVDVSEADIIKVKKGDPVAITFDAFGEDVKFSGEVFFIEPAQTVIQDVIYYKTTVANIKLAGKNQEENNINVTLGLIKPGMTANTIITTATKDNVLIIPSRAIIEKNSSGKFTRRLINKQVMEVSLSLGLKGDEGLVEVLAGVKEGDEVITFVKTNQ